MRVIRGSLLAMGAAALLVGSAASAVDGVIEINHSSITAAGGYPFAITAAGSYVLTGNLTAPPGATALNVNSDDVEINLNGFTIVGAGGGGFGISGSGNSGLTVRKGVVTGFTVAIGAGNNSKLIDLKISTNGQGVIGAVDCLIINSHIVDSVSDGIQALNCKIENNVIANNGGVGIEVTGESVIVHNRIYGNNRGINNGGGAKILENVIDRNVSWGISDHGASPPIVPPPPPILFPFPNANIVGNIISRTISGPGISITGTALVADNTVSGNSGNGIFCGLSCTVRGNVVERNNLGAAPGAGGVTVAAGSTVTANSISYNQGFGLMLPPTAGYTNNTITGNGTPLGVGPDVITPPSVTGAAGNNCSGGPCP